MEIEFDPNTSFSAKFDDVDTFKNLMNLVYDVLSTTKDLFFIFGSHFIQFDNRLTDRVTGMYLDTVCKIKGYRLTRYHYKSKHNIYIVKFNLKSLIDTIKNYNSKKNDYINISCQKGGKNIKIHKNKRYYDLIEKKEGHPGHIFQPHTYKTYPKSPIAVVKSTYLSEISKEYSKYDYDTIPMCICENGVAFMSRNSNNKLPVRIFGDIEGDPTILAKWKCKTSSRNLARLFKIEKIIPNGNVRIYIEEHKDGLLLPLLITASVGDIGVIHFYLETQPEKF